MLSFRHKVKDAFFKASGRVFDTSCYLPVSAMATRHQELMLEQIGQSTYDVNMNGLSDDAPLSTEPLLRVDDYGDRHRVRSIKSEAPADSGSDEYEIRELNENAPEKSTVNRGDRAFDGDFYNDGRFSTGREIEAVELGKTKTQPASEITSKRENSRASANVQEIRFDNRDLEMHTDTCSVSREGDDRMKRKRKKQKSIDKLGLVLHDQCGSGGNEFGTDADYGSGGESRPPAESIPGEVPRRKPNSSRVCHERASDGENRNRRIDEFGGTSGCRETGGESCEFFRADFGSARPFPAGDDSDDSAASDDSGSPSGASFDTQIMDILTDLDHALDESLAGDAPEMPIASESETETVAAAAQTIDRDDDGAGMLEKLANMAKELARGFESNVVASGRQERKRDEAVEEDEASRSEDSELAPDVEEEEDDPSEGSTEATPPTGPPGGSPEERTEAQVLCAPRLPALPPSAFRAALASVHRRAPAEADMPRRTSPPSRGSMRLLRPLPLPVPVVLPLPVPSAPPLSPSPPPDASLTLPVLLFMEESDPATYSPARLARPASADAPRVYGRRALGRRSVSLHVSPRVSPHASRERGSGRRDSADRTRSSSASSRRSRVGRSASSDSSSLSSADTAAAPHRLPPAEVRPASGAAPCASALGSWPHSFSSMLACLGCTVGIFNLSRFAIFSVHFGANFIVQFLFLSLIIGIPLLTLHLCLGQLLCSGPVDMWRISPIFQGVGIALLMAQALIGIYSVIGISWLFVYFRDSFITKVDRYRWAEPFGLYREDITVVHNGSYKLSETVPDYFYGVVLKRHNLDSTEATFGSVKFQITFNLAVVWMIVFVSLSKGLRSYGKVAYVFTFLPICGTLVLCAKLLSLTPHDSMYDVFPETSWNEFFINSKSWAAAAQETFLTWGLLGACAMQLASHNKKAGRPTNLKRDSAFIMIFTLVLLLLAAFLANTCMHIINHHGYNYMPGSFEQMSSYTFLRPDQSPLPAILGSAPVRHMSQQASLLGTHVVRPGTDPATHSGYQLLQLATELVPSTLAIIGPDKMSSFWAVLFYFILIMFGLAQQLAIWHCVITGIMAIDIDTMKSWETSVTFFSCSFGFLLGLPMTTDAGVLVVHFLDYAVVGIWWHCLLQVALLCGVFLVRGRPYSGDAVVATLCPPATAPHKRSCSATLAPLLSFTWNVILPVTLIALCVVDFRVGKYRQLYSWKRTPPGHEYWPLWCKKLGAIIQLLPLIVVPVTAFVQAWRYLGSGPPDILDRIQMLYRPPMEEPASPRVAPPPVQGTPPPVVEGTAPPPPDPPPKYTPPPSYSTATGARLAKLLRSSIRRSVRGVRRLAISFGESSTTVSQIPMSISESISHHHSAPQTVELPPPDYSILHVESRPADNRLATISISEAADTRLDQRSSSTGLDVEQVIRNEDETDYQRSTLPFTRAYQSFNANLQRSKNDSKITTASDVANLLRSSVRRSLRARTLPISLDGSISQECLLNQVEPISNTSIIFINENEADESNESPNETINNEHVSLEVDDTSSVI